MIGLVALSEFDNHGRFQDDEDKLVDKRRSVASSSSRSLTQPTEFDVSSTLLATKAAAPQSLSVTRPSKNVYSGRMAIERNWRRGRCTVRTLKGHTDGVMCLQFSETLSSPVFPVLITGSYDRTVRVWNLETGVELHCLKGHTRAVRALQFDEVKLITGSMDNTIKVWDWRSGKCIRTLTGHTQGVVCLNFDSNVLASGSTDSTIQVWDLRAAGAFTLRGHKGWVNAVQLWDSNPSSLRTSLTDTSLLDVQGSSSPLGASLQIGPGKMLFSASDDATIRLWDLTLRSCVKVFTGHVGEVQVLLLADECGDHPMEYAMPGNVASHSVSEQAVDVALSSPQQMRRKPILISGSLDNTIRFWDIETGQAIRTCLGHTEGVWAVASNKLRFVSASHDRTIRVP